MGARSMFLKSALIFLLTAAVLSSYSCAYAYDPDSRDLMKRMQGLEQEIMELKSALHAVKKEQKDISATVGKAPGKPSVVSSIPVELYGYVKLDAVYSDSANPLGSTALQMNAPQEDSSGSNPRDADEFVMDARETRLGLKLKGMELNDGGTLAGKVETDFWQSGATNSPQLRLRQAFVTLNYPNWNLLAGQTWDFFSPLGPSILNFAYLWRAGNLGDRHPQIVLTSKHDKVTTKIGIIHEDDITQTKSGAPVFGAHVGFNAGPAWLGFGGIYGTEDAAGDDAELWAVTAQWKWKLSDRVKFLGEGFYGSNLNSFRGGSPTGTLAVGTVTKGVRANGGWAQLQITPMEKLLLGIGSGIDNTVLKPTTGSIWDYNYTYFVNLKYKLAKNLTWGVEWQRFITKYTHKTSGTANRCQTSLIYSF